MSKDKVTAPEEEIITGDEIEISSEEIATVNDDPQEGDMETPVLSLEDQIEQLQVELTEAKEDRLRAIADAQNSMRRSQREVENARKYAAEPMARNLIPVIDNLQRALEAVPADKAESDVDLKNLRVGVEMTAKEFDSAFKKAGIERLFPMDEPFDPNLHQAMYEIPDADADAGTVKNVIGAGYKLHDRLLRAAMVGVTKKP